MTGRVFEGTNGTQYNLTALRGTVVGPVATTHPAGAFYFSVCDGVMPAGTCSAAATAADHLHVCFAPTGQQEDQPQQQQQQRVSYGAELEFVGTAGAGTGEDDASLLLNFHGGHSDSACGSNGRWTTTVVLRCSPSAGVGVPQLLSHSEATCTATFGWASLYACHTCTPADYEQVVTACTHGRQRTELHKTGRCNGADRVVVSETACTDVAVPVGVVVGVAVVVAALVAAVVFVVYKNRKITYKYTKLLQDQGADLEAMADDRRPAAVVVVVRHLWPVGFCQSAGVAKCLEEHSDVHGPGCEMDKGKAGKERKEGARGTRTT